MVQKRGNSPGEDEPISTEAIGFEDAYPPKISVNPWDDDFGTTPATQLSYRPYIGLAVAPTWGDLGRWVNRIRAAETNAAQLEVALKWADEVHPVADRQQDYGPQLEYSVEPGDLIVFTNTVVDLLERKLKGKPIAADANNLIAPMGAIVFEDREQNFVARESRDAFWALEYYYLFSRLASDPLWWKAVGYCDNDTCRKFFIKQRRDNRFDSDKCRQNASNRQSYRLRTRSHGGSK